jgi:hypothetical protein
MFDILQQRMIYYNKEHKGSRDSSMSIVTWILTKRTGGRVSITGGTETFLFTNAFRPAVDSTQAANGYLTGVTCQGHEARHLNLRSTKVMNP